MGARAGPVTKITGRERLAAEIRCLELNCRTDSVSESVILEPRSSLTQGSFDKMQPQRMQDDAIGALVLWLSQLPSNNHLRQSVVALVN